MATVIGLTASIAAGKTTVSEIFRSHGALVIDCDKIVNDLYLSQEGIGIVKNAFPEAVIEDKVSKELLRKHAFATAESKARLESLIHPIVQAEVKKFIQEHPQDLIVIEIQLLFESKADKNPAYAIDYTVVVDAPKERRRERALRSRAYLNEEIFDKIDSQQMPHEEKKRRADFVIDNFDGADVTDQVREIISKTFHVKHPN